MMLTEDNSVPVSMLPVQVLKDHLRLGSGFSDDGLQDGLLATYLRAAIAAIEHRTDKALLSRRFRLQLENWFQVEDNALPLPIAPVTALISLILRDNSGVSKDFDISHFMLIPDTARPKVKALRGFPQIRENELAYLIFTAGYGSDWDMVPPDLAQAVILLAAEYYERRHEGDARANALPAAVQALIEPWRVIRTFTRKRAGALL